MPLGSNVAGNTLTSSAYADTTAVRAATDPSTAAHRPGIRRASASAPANPARYEVVRPASTQESSGATDQATDAAVQAASAANSNSAEAPQARAGAASKAAAAASPAPTTIRAISAQVFGPRSVPPVVTNAIAPSPTVSSAPRATSGVTRRRAQSAALARRRSEAVAKLDMIGEANAAPGAWRSSAVPR